MPSIISIIGYIAKSNTILFINSSDNTNIAKWIIVCNRPNKNNIYFVNFIVFHFKDKEDSIPPINQDLIYSLYSKFVYNTIRNNGENHHELQVIIIYKSH